MAITQWPLCSRLSRLQKQLCGRTDRGRTERASFLQCIIYTLWPVCIQGPWTREFHLSLLFNPDLPYNSKVHFCPESCAWKPAIFQFRPRNIEEQPSGRTSGIIFQLVLWSHLKKKNSPEIVVTSSKISVPIHGTWAKRRTALHQISYSMVNKNLKTKFHTEEQPFKCHE